MSDFCSVTSKKEKEERNDDVERTIILTVFSHNDIFSFLLIEPPHFATKQHSKTTYSTIIIIITIVTCL